MVKSHNTKNPKNFTEEQALEIWTRQDWRCAGPGCGKRCGSPEQMYQIHHIKYKSRMRPKDLKKWGTAGSTKNGVGLCQTCHNFTHDGLDEFAMFRTSRNSDIGITEADLSFAETES